MNLVKNLFLLLLLAYIFFRCQSEDGETEEKYKIKENNLAILDVRNLADTLASVFEKKGQTGVMTPPVFDANIMITLWRNKVGE